MSKFLTENLFLLEFLVVELTYEYEMIRDLRNFSETNVRLQFLNHEILAAAQNSAIKEKVTRGGTSCLFSLNPNQAEDALNEFDLHVSIYKTLSCGSFSEKLKVGECLITIVELYQKIMLEVQNDNEDVKARTMDGAYKLTNITGSVIGEIKLFIRMSCFGKLIVSQFKMDTASGRQFHSLILCEKKSGYTSNTKTVLDFNIPMITPHRTTPLSSGEPCFKYNEVSKACNNYKTNVEVGRLMSTPINDKFFIGEHNFNIKNKRHKKITFKFGKYVKTKRNKNKVKSRKRAMFLKPQKRLSAGGVQEANASNYCEATKLLTTIYPNTNFPKPSYDINQPIAPECFNSYGYAAQNSDNKELTSEVETLKFNFATKDKGICKVNNNVELQVCTPKGIVVKPEPQMISLATNFDYNDLPKGYLESYYGKEVWKKMLAKQLVEEKMLALQFGNYNLGSGNFFDKKGQFGKRAGNGNGNNNRNGKGKESSKNSKQKGFTSCGAGILKEPICYPCQPCVPCNPCKNIQHTICNRHNMCINCKENVTCW